MTASVTLGLALALAGLILAAVAWGFLRLFAASRLPANDQWEASEEPSSEIEEAVILVDHVGRVNYISSQGRESFGLKVSDTPTLEQLARRVKPPEDFLELCAVVGQKRLVVNGRTAEVASHTVPSARARMLVTVKILDLSASAVAGGEGGASAGVVADFTAAVMSSLNLETVLRNVADNTLTLISADLFQLSLRNPDTDGLVAYALEVSGGPDGGRLSSGRGQFGALTTSLLETRTALVLPSPTAPAEIPTSLLADGIVSYLGLPLLVSGELMGALELGRTAEPVFAQPDLDLSEMIAGPTAAAINNAMRYEAERRRAAELSGLAKVSQSVTALRNPHELFERLVESIASLFKAQVVGLLLYDEDQHVLAGQIPFHGLPDSIVEAYRSHIEPGSAAAGLLKEPDPLLTANPTTDARWRDLGLADVAVAASLKDTALVPLIASGRMLGYLQVSHRAGDTGNFADSELHLLRSVSGQAAAILESAKLVQGTGDQGRRSTTLAGILSIPAASTTVDETLSRTLADLARLFGAELAAALLLDEARGRLDLHVASAIGFPAQRLAAAPSVVIDDPAFFRTVTASQQAHVSHRLSLDAHTPEFYRELLQGLGVESALIVPLVAHAKSLGELILASRRADYFVDADADLLRNVGAHVAFTLESSRLASHTDGLLRRRVDQLSAMVRVSRELAGSPSVDHLLTVIHDEAIHLTGADCASVFILEAGEIAGGGRRTRSTGCRSGDELSQVEQRALEGGKLLSVADFGRQEFPPPHAGVKSAILVPLLKSGRPIGLLQLHATRPVAFDGTVHETAETLAAQAAAALGNARQLDEERRQGELMQRRAETLQKFSAASHAVDPEQPLERSLASIAEGIRNSTPFRVVLISVYEQESGMLRRVTGAGIEPETLAELQARKQPISTLRQLLKPEFRISRSYYIPADQTPVLPPDIHYVYASEYSVAQAKQNAWDPDDFLLLPLEDAAGEPLGLISLDDPSNGLRPDRATIESVELFAGQANQVIKNARRMKDLHGQVDSLSAALERQQQLLSVTQNDLPVLLRKDLEQTIALHNLDRKATRNRSGLAIIEAVSQQSETSSALTTLARETLTQLAMTTALIGENMADGPQLTSIVGKAPPTTNAEALFGQRNPLRTVLQTGVPILLPDVQDNDEWRDSPLLRQLRARAVVGLPVLIGDRVAAGMLALSSEPMPSFTDEDRQLYQQISRQASVVLQNLSLLKTTRGRLQEVNTLLEFSRRLTGLDASQILSALLDSARAAVTTAQAGYVLSFEEATRTLVPRAISGFPDGDAMLRLSLQPGEALPGRVFASGKPQRVDAVDFSKDYRLRTENLGLYRQGTGGRLPVSSLVLPILLEDRSIGVLVLDAFSAAGGFSTDDETLAASMCQQAALSLENVRLFAETQKLAQEMEHRVVERTAELSRAQQNAEALLRKEQEEASRSQAILESVADGVVVTGHDNRITFLNPSVERILGADAARVLGQPIESFGGLFGEPGKVWLETIHGWSVAPAASRPGETYAERLELGHNRIALIHLAPVILDQDFLGTVSILRDITQEVEVDRLKSEFVATVSHELRTPMTSIKGYVEMLLMGAGGALNENQSHFLDVVKRNVDRLNRLVDDLLDVSRIESGKVSLAQEEIDLQQIAADAVAEMQRKSGEDNKPMAFSLSSPEAVPHVLGDPERVRQVVLSLLDNAYHYTPENGSVNVRLQSLTERSEVQLDVADNGIGILKTDHDRMFERFHRGEDPLVLATPGTGLGLAISKQLVEMQHGRIWFTSEGVPGRGSTFSIALPVYHQQVPLQAPEAATER